MVRSAQQNGRGGIAEPLPEGWECVAAGEVCSKITKGTTPPAAEVSDDGEIPFVRVNNLTIGGARSLSGQIIFVSRHAHTGFLSRSIAFPGDVLMNIVGPPLGKVTKLDHTFQEYNLNQAVLIYRTIGKRLNNEFLYYYLSSDVAQQWLDNRAKQTSGQKNLTIELCKELPVPLPPLSEQAKIAQVLSTWDQAIEKQEQLIANRDSHKAVVMRSLLTGGRRLEGFRHEWSIRRLGDVFDERVEINRQGLPLLSITGDKGVIPQDEVGRKNISADDKSTYKRICPDDIGYNTMRMWQGVSARSRLEGIVSPAYTIVVSNGDIDPVFASHLFKLPRTVHDFRRLSQGLTSDTWNLKFPLFSRVQVRIPAIKEQRAIAGVLSALDAEIGIFRRDLELLKTERAALVQQLLIGKRRVRVDEAGTRAACA